MKLSPSTRHHDGLTLIEVLVILAVLAVLFVMIFPPRDSKEASRNRIGCVISLKHIGEAERNWMNDHGGKFTFEVSQTNGGTMEFTTGANAWRHFQVLSNGLETPKDLLCVADWSRLKKTVTNFTALSNSNLSYFMDLDATETDPQRVLCGDRNITNNAGIKNGILEVTTNEPFGWTDEMHKHRGNLLLADGSVQQESQTGLRVAIENTSVFTNRLQMPILGP